MKASIKRQRGIPVKTKTEMKREKRERKQSLVPRTPVVIDNRPVLGIFESKSKPGTYHKVRHTVGSGILDCPCIGFQMKGVCSHVERVIGANQGGIRMILQREKDTIARREGAYQKMADA